MDIDNLRTILLQWPGVSEDIKWEHNLVFSVAGKMFLLVNMEEPYSRALKVPDEDFEELCLREGFGPAPHLARAKWVAITPPFHLTAREWQNLIKTSYSLVVNKLPKKLRTALTPHGSKE